MPRRQLFQFHLLFDPAPFRSMPDLNEESGAALWDSLHWESFLERLQVAFELPALTCPKERWAGGTLVWHEAGGRRLRVGVDMAAEPFAVFVVPGAYERRSGAVLKPYKVARDARKGFNRLIRACPELRFSRRFPDGSIGPITRYRLTTRCEPQGASAR
jgi:hypothetical protein